MKLAEAMISLIAPHSCLGCGAEGGLLCLACQMEYLQAPPSRCGYCLRVSGDSATCAACRRHIVATNVWVASAYEDKARDLVRKLKYDGGRQAVTPMAAAICRVLPYLDPDWLVVSMPTITSHQRIRGFDHAKLLASEVAKTKSLQFRPVLVRSGQIRQVGAKADARRSQLVGTMRISAKNSLKNAKILLIDDVLTTGASIAEASRVLKAAGARQVCAAVFAQKVL